MLIQGRSCGQVEIDERQVITLPKGLLGFESFSSWALLDSSQAPFYWLQSLDDSDLAFVILDPTLFRPDYKPDLSPADIDLIGSPKDEELLVFAIVTIPEDANLMTANLQGPLVINRNTRRGLQSIQTDTVFKTRHYVYQELAALGNNQEAK